MMLSKYLRPTQRSMSRGWSTSPKRQVMRVRTPVGKHVDVKRIGQGQMVQITGTNLRVELTVLDLHDFDAILGMD